MPLTELTYERRLEQVNSDEQFVDCKACPDPSARERCELRSCGLSSSELITSIVTLPRQTTLFKQGDPVRSLYVVCEGYLKLSLNCGPLQRMVIHIVGPGSMVGLNGALSHGVFEVSAESITDARVRAVDRDAFLECVFMHPELQTRLLQSLCQFYGSALQAATRLGGNRSASERVGNVLVDLSEQVGNIVHPAEVRFPLLLTHDEVASMAGTTRETVTRVLNQFRKEGWISVNSCWVTIHSPTNVRNVDAFNHRGRRVKSREAQRGVLKNLVIINQRSEVPMVAQ